VADDDAIAGLIVDLAELRREVDELRGVRDQLSDVAATVAAVRDQLERAAAAGAAVRPRIVWWPDLDHDDAAREWATLTAWIDEVLLHRYPEAARVLYPCWDRHPDVVDMLTALHATWHAAYHVPTAAPVDTAIWLDRWLPSLLGHMRSGLRSCERSAHADLTAAERT
jgi:hypothetical protein